MADDGTDETIDFLFAVGMKDSKQWFEFCNGDSIGDGYSLILGKVDNKITILTQNNTFADCIGPGSNCRTQP